MTSVDRLIDDVARRMTAVDAPDGFPARTLARIAAHRRPAIFWKLVPVTAVAGLAVAGGLVLRVPDRPVAPAGDAAGAAPVRVAETSPALVADPPATLANGSTLARAGSIPEQIWNARRIPDLARPAAIEHEDIQPDALVVPLLQVKPLVTEPLTIEPMHGGG